MLPWKVLSEGSTLSIAYFSDCVLAVSTDYFLAIARILPRGRATTCESLLGNLASTVALNTKSCPSEN